MEKLQSIIDLFQSVDTELRLEFLLDYSRRLQPLNEQFHEARDAGLGKVPEYQTPVFLFLESDRSRVRLHVDVGEEAPTVMGLLSIFVAAFDSQPAETLADLPLGQLNRLGLQEVIRMNRAIGFSAMIGQLKSCAANATSAV